MNIKGNPVPGLYRIALFLAAFLVIGLFAPAHAKVEGTSDYKFPWTAGQAWYYTGGPHPGYIPASDATWSAIDFGTPTREVSAVDGGTVIFSDWYDGVLGNVIGIQHEDGYASWYAHLETMTVQAGTRVGRGYIIGRSGSSGTGAPSVHLHFVLTRQGRGEQIAGHLLSGWSVESTGPEYQGKMTKPGEQDRIAEEAWSSACIGLQTCTKYPWGRNDLVSDNFPVITHNKPFNLWLPRWYYLIDTGDSKVIKVYLDGNLLFEKPACAKALWIDGNDHVLTIWYEATGSSIPQVDIKHWPFATPVCAAEGGGDPPIDSEPIQGTYNATFTGYETYPDGASVSPNQSFDKTWGMKNTGSSTWGAGYQLCFIGGEKLGAPSCVGVPSTGPNGVVNISVNMTAPASGGTYRGDWRMRNPPGTYFGDTVWVLIKVPDLGGDDGGTGEEIELACLNCSPAYTPGEIFRPTIRATVRSGQLLQSRGDHLLNSDGNLFGAHPLIEVVGTVHAGQEYDFTFYEDDPLRAPDSEGTYQTCWRTWRDNNWAGEELCIQFDVRHSSSNHRPNTPSTRSPLDWWVQWDGGQVTLCADHNGDPDSDAIVGYEFNVQGANNWNSGEVGSDCATTEDLGFYTYGWRVRVKDSKGAWSDWSDPEWRFTIHNAAAIEGPEFSPSSPSAAQTVNVWACSNGGTMKYWVNLANDGSGNGQWWQFYEGPICTNPERDEPNTWPGWQTFNYTDGPHLVRVENGLGGTVEGVYTLQPRRPAWPEPLNPPDHSFQNTRTILFTWGHGMFGGFPTRATSYTLRVSTNPDPDQSPILDVTVGAGTTSYTHTFNQDHPVLYWHVIAQNAQGATESNTFQFGIDRVAPSSSVSALPSISTETAISVSWGGTDNTGGIRWYDVQYSDRNHGQWVDWQRAISTTVAIFQGQAGHTYDFRARALDKAGNQEAYPGGSGDTSTTIDLSARPPTEWWEDSAYAYKRNVLLQNQDSNALPVGYPLWLHFDDTTTPTAGELYSASLSSVKGDDFRLIHNNQTQLNRYIQTFQSDRIDIWFNLPASLDGLASDGSSYQLYYSNPSAINPPGDIDDVLPPGRDANTVGLWHFIERSGAAFSDSSGQGHHGSLSGPYNWGEDAFGSYIEWPGGGDGTAWGEVASSSDFDLSQLTMEAWVYPIDGGTPEMTILNRPASTENCPGYRLAVSDRKIDFQTCPGPRAIDGQLSFNTWYHIAATFDGSDMRIYRNGSLIRTVSGQPLRSTAGRLLYLGGAPWNQTFKGRVRHVRLSNIARTDFSYAAQIASISTAPDLKVGDAITPPVAGSPDLAMLNLITYPNPDGGVLVQAIFQNQGEVSTQNGFFTDLYADHLPTDAGDYTGSIQFWVNDPIAAGATVTLTTVITDLSGLGLMSPLIVGAISESSATLYTQVDSTGVISETDNANNIYPFGTEICLASPDAHESDDSAETAKSIGVGQTQTHNFDSPGDRDWIKFSAEAGKTYTLHTSNLGSSADTYLYLYDTDGTTLLAANDDSGGTLASQIDWTAPATGLYYLAVQHWNPNAGGCGTSYTLSFAGALSDLVVSIPQPSASPPFEVRQIVNWSVTTTNQGGNIARASHVGYYLGTACNDLSNRVADTSVSSLAPNASENDSTHYIFQPGDVGIRHLIAKADYLNEEPDESDENNNTSCYGPFEVRAFTAPDLVVSAPQPSISPPFAVGQTVNWSVTTTNQGNEAASATHTGYYLGVSCNDEKIIWFDGDPVGPLGSGGSEPDSAPYTFQPGDTGTHYVIAWADDLNEEPNESVEHNNRNCYGPFVVQAVTMSDLVDSGRQIRYLPMVHLAETQSE